MLARTTRQYATMPGLPGRGPLPPMVSVIVPLARTNLITNPSIELATTGYTAVGGSIARVATQQYHGTYSLEVTPSAGTNSDGAFFGTVSLTTAIPYAYSVKFKATGTGIGKTYALSIATTGGVDLSATQFVATGRWQWIRGIYGETSSTTRRVYIRKVNHSAASAFYADGWQVESCVDGILEATTYIDGDQQGLLIGQQPPPYLWNGTPNGATSSRSALTRAGGYVINLSSYNFLLAGIVGLGMAAPNNVSIPYTILDGARYQRTQKPPRTLALAGRFQADTVYELMQSQSDMRAVFDRDLSVVQQPLLLQVEPQDECGNVIGDFATVQCLYAGGLEGNDGNYPAEDVAPTFTMYLPFLIGGDAGTALTVPASVTNANGIVQRSPTGTWRALGTGISGGTARVFAMTYGLDGTLYIGGGFTDAGGSGADYFAKWDGSAWSVVKSATSINQFVAALATGPDGRIYLGGDFTNADGIAAADYIAVYDPVANMYAALGTGGGSGDVLALAFDPSGNLYAGGTFASMGGVATTASLAKWNGSAWSSLGNIGGGGVNGIASDVAGNIYITGGFTNIGVPAFSRVAKYNGTAWSTLGTGLASDGQAIIVGPNNQIYVAGLFATAGGVTVNFIARWNGASWSALSSGLDAGAYSLGLDGSGLLYVGGTFTTAGGITLPDRAARWSGSAWQMLDIDLPGTATVYAIKAAIDGTLTLGYDTAGSATAAITVTAANDGPAVVYPVLTLRGTSGSVRIYQFVNYTTGISVYFNYTILAGETAVFDFDPTHPRAMSTFFGDITSKILPSSGAIYLAPGNNTVSFFASAATATAVLSWKKRYNGLADLVN